MTTVTICREWNNPQIHITVSNKDIALEMTLDDFLIALADEAAEPIVESIAGNAGNPSFWFTKEALTKNLVKALEGNIAHTEFVKAANRIIDKVKLESTKVM